MVQALRRVRGALLLLPAVALAMPTGASAQSLGFGVTKAFVDNTEFLHTAWRVTYAQPVGSYGLEVRLPIGLGRPEGGDGQTAIGNPYIGLSRPGSGSLSYFAGVSLPLAPNDVDKAVAVGALVAADVTDMSSMPDYLTVDAGVSSSSESVFYGGAAQLLVFTGDDDGRDGTEIFVRGWGGMNFPMESVTLSAGARGNFWLTQGDVDGDVVNLGIFGGASLAAGPGNLGATLTIPLTSDWSDGMSASIDVGYSLPLN